MFIFSSCADDSKSDIAVYRATTENLENSNKSIAADTLLISKAFENKLQDPAIIEKAKMWEPKIELIKKMSADLLEYIQVLKDDLKQGSTINSEKGEKILQESNTDAVTMLFYKRKKGEELHGKLIKYKEEMMKIDSGLNRTFKDRSIIITDSYDSKEDFTTTFFKRIPTIAALAVLNGFENNVNIMENEFLTFCFNNTCTISFDDSDRPWPLVIQSSSFVKAGDIIEINAGLGIFKILPKPKITINGRIIPLNENAIATYNLKTPLKTGKYTLPVKFEFTAPDGTVQFMTKTISYTVAE